MLAEVGYIALWLAFIFAIYAIGSSVFGEMRHNEKIVLSGRNASILAFVFMTISTGALQYALITEQYQITYVWSVSNPQMPMFFRVTSLWGSQAGSIVFWSWLMTVFSFLATILNWRSHRRLMPYAIAYMMAATAFFIGLSLAFENPFERWWIMPDLPTSQQVVSAVFQPAGAVAPSASSLASSAKGLNPLLRHFGMAIHPPMLYLGFTGFLIRFAYAMSALASGELSTNWIKASRRWALVAWLFLSLGLLLGGRWAYDVLGWGGYWGWDPVENAAFLPWLIGTAFLHSVMIQEKRGMLKTWNMFLVIGTFSAVVFGSFATRSGLVESVHSFARSEIGFPFFLFWFLMTIISVGLIMWRRGQGLLRDEHRFTSLFSREALFVLNNIIFVALFVAIFWGSFGAPIISELFMNTNITLGTDYFMQVTPPLFAALYILMGVAPLSAWGVSSIRRLGKSILIPVVLSILSLSAFLLMGVTNIAALLGYGIVLLAGWVALYETFRSVRSRVRTHGENPLSALWRVTSRNPRRYGGYLIHLGISVIGIGVIGSTLFQVETQRTMAVGESIEVGGYVLRYDQFDGGQISADGRLMDIANLTVSRDGTELSTLRPRRDFFPGTDGMNTMTIAGAYSTVENDFYVILLPSQEMSAQSATFRIYINPLINLVWWGGLILILGTIIATVPQEVMSTQTRRRLQNAPVPLAAGAGD
ncbi:MAG: heme lyase CcmF/NrfE family subunit [Anaerolineae bacterium]|nr:heme lyase CcmF/NrfE family subunit [Anaerolineae bacterium]